MNWIVTTTEGNTTKKAPSGVEWDEDYAQRVCNECNRKAEVLKIETRYEIREVA